MDAEQESRLRSVENRATALESQQETHAQQLVEIARQFRDQVTAQESTNTRMEDIMKADNEKLRAHFDMRIDGLSTQIANTKTAVEVNEVHVRHNDRIWNKYVPELIKIGMTLGMIAAYFKFFPPG